MNDLWHFTRPDDAERLLKTLNIGLVSAIAIIEPRRRGKTTFLLADLLPAAQAHGMLPIYINLAAASGELEPFMATSIAAALQAQASRASKLGSQIKKLSAKASLTGIELSGEVDPALPSQAGTRLDAVFRRITALGKPVLFLLDEVHKLAEDRHAQLAWSLRSLLDTHRQTIKVVATSSSAATYDALVSGEKRAFKSWFTRVSLTPLGAEFVDHLAAVIQMHFPKHPIRRNEIEQAFEVLGRSPKFVRDYLNERVLDPGLAHSAALSRVATLAAQDSGYDDEFVNMPALQKVVLFALASGQRELFSDAALHAFAQATGTPLVTKTALQRSVRLLAHKGWIVRIERGDYRIADNLFEQWLSSQVRSGLLALPVEH